MIRIKFTDVELEKIYEKAKSEKRTVLGVIYSEYIGVHFPEIEILNARNIYTTTKFISRLLTLDKSLSGEKANLIYFQYAPSIFKCKTFNIEENELIAQSMRGEIK